ncbi:HAD-IIA family hydrolase [Rhodococcus hoagii]|uniref:HAD-IIA family hydrolase n=3 Tax=Rhodococcus hoagii TaxID=43767 RepID=A0A9Q2SH75_RHOHA|nr:TIGR01458 family HAD-type hydrolase [Prescottella equi]ERN44762.1 haloacid dehalogenase [Prescottella equi NBRC 101255 = C 7]CBH49849.1 putative haloacid dehalogenase-like hydrolase [Prescottella equi 103S]GBF16209.1 ribonucleotide monophosphatase NagD [Rhodococcus sp. Br-6]MBM4472472.1 HAD-IIA family hydrolase [Prescottella equi]
MQQVTFPAAQHGPVALVTLGFMTGVEGVLFDIDGVLVTSWKPVPGAVEALAEVRRRGGVRAFLTNTTSRTCDEIAAALGAAGFDVRPEEIVTAARLTTEYLRSTYPGEPVLLLNHGDIRADMPDVEFDDVDPRVVVIGGAGPEFTHEALSRVLDLMVSGVPVVAMHRALMWSESDGLRLDTGAYLPGLEDASGSRIVSVGKPSLAGFLTAAELMGADPASTVMVGDDFRSDVLPAQRVGMTGVLVRTGKFRQPVLDLAVDRPDHILDSVADLPALLDRLG